MLDRRPAEPGMALMDVETPALLVDLDALTGNIESLARYLDGATARGVVLRPHAKTHKSAVIAAMQVRAGAVGACCQTVGEVEALVEGGIGDVMLANEIGTADKADRLAAAAVRARVAVCVDDPRQVDLLADAARRHGATLHLFVEIDVGGGRCGVAPGEAAVALARTIRGRPGLTFAGLQAYHGPAQHLREPAQRAAAIEGAARLAATTADLLVAAGFDRPLITGAGTGTFEHEAASGVYGELQCGSYVFMDADYGRNRRDAGSAAPRFAQSLFVLSTVLSVATPGRIVTDAGLKAISFDSGPPLVAGHPDLVHLGPSDEHGTLRGEGHGFRVGDKLRFVPGHCDPTVALHDWIVAYKGDTVVDLWPIARGL